MSKRLEILKKSLEKKQQLFNDGLQNHIDTIKQSNGQPLNDKGKKGLATLKKWDNQNEALKTKQESIEKTERAIERETSKINTCEYYLRELPKQFAELVASETITQWRKYPNRFFVKGVDKARIFWDKEKKIVNCSYYQQIPTTEQKELFKQVFYALRDDVAANPPTEPTE